MAIIIAPRVKIQHYLENQARMSPAQKQMCKESRHLAFFVPEKKSIPQAKRVAIFDRDGGICRWCACELSRQNFHIDHIIPRARGGDDEYENLCASCPSCNLEKGADIWG